MKKEIRAWIVILAMQLAWIIPCGYDSMKHEPEEEIWIESTEDVLRFDMEDVEIEEVVLEEIEIETVTEPNEEEISKHEDNKSMDFDAYESYLLAKIAMAEAGCEDTEGKALVILTVLNRVHDSKFPNSIEEVIYQKNQFSPIWSGSFDSLEPSEDCWAALDLVIDGWDESHGALYFESRNNSTWHEDNLDFLFQHGRHYFYTEKGRYDE